jgi:cytochrome c-type biogenesis protein CcsB
MESIALAATLIVTAVATVLVLVALIGGRTRHQTNGGTAEAVRPGLETFSTILMGLGLLALTISIITRGITTGHGPFTNMYEFAVAFAWGILAMGLIFHWRYQAPFVKVVTMVVAIGLILFAMSISNRPNNLVPALQQSYLLTAHVASAAIAYGTFTTGFAAALLYLFQRRNSITWMPAADKLDDMSYRAVMIGFPFLTLLIILGALWADIAWGRYWGWDPKETASLVTWLVYAGYLHARVMRGWRGSKAAVLLIIGFLAVIFTFFGNYIFSGLHAYNG